MLPLLVLAIVLLALWIWGVTQGQSSAAFMDRWVHVLLFAGTIVLLMAIGTLFR
jgi:hypothetical protein